MINFTNAAKTNGLNYETHTLTSLYLKREVRIDVYRSWLTEVPKNNSLLIVNDGQELQTLDFNAMVKSLSLQPLMIVAAHAGPDRMNEYGLLQAPDYAGRGAKAKEYLNFLEKELMPFLQFVDPALKISERAMAGFSLGGLSAIDVVWNRPDLFNRAGVFSGALWWRSADRQSPEYSDEKSRMMHVQIRNSEYKAGLKFFLQCGHLDEAADRNGNGVIDSVDDTRDLVAELEKKGYKKDEELCILEMPEGRHNIATWAQALPLFLKWGWGKD